MLVMGSNMLYEQCYESRSVTAPMKNHLHAEFCNGATTLIQSDIAQDNTEHR